MVRLKKKNPVRFLWTYPSTKRTFKHVTENKVCIRNVIARVRQTINSYTRRSHDVETFSIRENRTVYPCVDDQIERDITNGATAFSSRDVDLQTRLLLVGDGRKTARLRPESPPRGRSPSVRRTRSSETSRFRFGVVCATYYSR